MPATADDVALTGATPLGLSCRNRQGDRGRVAGGDIAIFVQHIDRDRERASGAWPLVGTCPSRNDTPASADTMNVPEPYDVVAFPCSLDP